MKIGLRVTSVLRKKIILAIASLFLAFALSEITLRLLQDKRIEPTACRQRDPILDHSLVPNSTCRFKTREWDITYKINSIGLRAGEVSAKNDDEIRILFLGDSFVEGFGVNVENRFTELIEDELRNKLKNINVINAGISSYSPILELEFLKWNFDSIQPDIVVVGLDMTDFKDEIGYYNFIRERDLKDVKKQEKPDSPDDYIAALGEINAKQKNIQEFKKETEWQQNENLSLVTRLKILMRYFKLYVMLTNYIKDTLNKPYLTEGSPPLIEGDIETDLFAIARNDLPKDVYESLWRLPRKSLSDFADYSHEKNFKLIFFTYPHGMQADGEQWSKGRLTRGFIRGKTYSTKPLEDLIKIGEELNVQTLNLQESFRENSHQKLYFDFDGHWNKEGHKVVAQAFLAFLTSKIL